ncbi:MAG: hypothetical protein WCF84_07935 [Anaerolineae bacterium]
MTIADWFITIFSAITLIVTIRSWYVTAAKQTELAARQGEIEKIVHEHDTRFSYVYQKQGEVIDRLFRHVATILDIFSVALASYKVGNSPPQETELVRGFNAVADFIDYYNQTKLYLDKGLCQLIDKFIERLNEAYANFTTMQSFKQYLAGHDPAVMNQYTQLNKDLREVVYKDLPPIQREIAKKMQTIIGLKEGCFDETFVE